MANVLVVAAHPDDEVLGCGGLIARQASEEQQFYIAILGEGITSRYAERDHAEVAQVATLQDSCRRASDLLGANDLSFYGLPDNRFDTIPLLDVVKIVEDLIERLQPEVVYTHHGGDLNIDHALTHRAVMTATRPVPDCLVREVYAFEIASSTEWAFQRYDPSFRPNVFVDISQTLETKVRAMEMYDTEIRPFPHPRSPEALRAIAQRWGSVAGLEAAEAFELIRSIRP